MASARIALNLNDESRRALAQVYALLIRLADEEAADGDTLEATPDSAASDSADEAPSHKENSTQ